MRRSSSVGMIHPATGDPSALMRPSPTVLRHRTTIKRCHRRTPRSASYARPPREVTLDIDDTVDVVHGAQQLSLFNTHHGERCFLPIHVYETATARPVAVLLRPGK